MKTFTWIAFAALLVTGGILWSRRQARQVIVIPAPYRAAMIKTNSFGLRPRPAATPVRERFRTPWDALQARDYAGFVELLREAGCPEDTVRIFAIAALGREHQGRAEEPMRARVRASTYWRDEWLSPEVPGQMKRQRADLDATLSRLLHASMSEIRQDFTQRNLPPDWLANDGREQLDTLLGRQRTEVEAIEERGIPSVAGGITLDEALRTELKTLREQHRGELEQLLGAKGFTEYEGRESIEANYLRQHLPPAKSEEEFRLLVRAARDVGFTESEILTDTILPPEVLVERPGLQERVLARFREISDPNSAAELQDAIAEASRRAEEERKAEDEASSLANLQRLARRGGVELSDDETRSLRAAMQRRGAELERERGDLGKLSEAELDALKQRIRIEFEQVAVNAVGETKGRAIADQMRKERPGR